MGKLPEGANILFRNIAGSDDTELKEIGDPFGILIVILLTLDSLAPFRIGNNNIGNMPFQCIVYRNTVLASGSHAYILTIVFNKPFSKLDQLVIEG